jgi:hypothetical protein
LLTPCADLTDATGADATVACHGIRIYGGSDSRTR